MPVRSATSPAAHPTRARVRSYRGFFSFLPFLSSFPFLTLRADGDCCGFDGVVLRSGLPGLRNFARPAGTSWEGTLGPRANLEQLERDAGASSARANSQRVEEEISCVPW